MFPPSQVCIDRGGQGRKVRRKVPGEKMWVPEGGWGWGGAQ